MAVVRPQLITVAVALAVVIALGLHIFMLAGVGSPHVASQSFDRIGVTTTDHDVVGAPSSSPASHAGSHAAAGCVAVLAVLALAAAIGARRRITGTAVTPPRSARLETGTTAADLPPPAGPLVGADVLLRI